MDPIMCDICGACAALMLRGPPGKQLAFCADCYDSDTSLDEAYPAPWPGDTFVQPEGGAR